MEDIRDKITTGNFCYYVDEFMLTDDGYRPSIVVRGVSGHIPNGGGDVQPWFWGHDLEKAKEIARQKNAEMGLTKEDCVEIIASSMRAQNEEDANASS